MTHYFGVHHDSNLTFKALQNSALIVKKYNYNLIQLFVSANALVKKYSKEDLVKYRKFMEKNNMLVVVHSSYLNNIARNWDKYSWWIRNIQNEIKIAHYIGAKYLVLHFGKQLDLSKNIALNNMYMSLFYIHETTLKYSDVQILLETPAGQGTEMCVSLEDLSNFYKKISTNPSKEFKDRIKLCLDTCHIFSAGYDIRTSQSIKEYFNKFEKLIGIRYIKLIHLNDSKVNLGARVDRHMTIGEGFIGLKGLKIIFNYFKKLNVPIVLETPYGEFTKEFKLLN
jgi:deoxyribonuclease-4